jgi:hypothetical protein
MIHHRQRLPLGLEPRDHLLGVHPQLDNFERHGHIDHAAAAFAQLLEQFVSSNPASQWLPGRAFRHNHHSRRRRSFGQRVQETLGLEVAFEHPLQPRSGCWIVSARAIEKSGAFGTGSFKQGRFEQSGLRMGVL